MDIKHFGLAAIAIFSMTACGNKKTATDETAANDAPIKVIFETDMGNDVDDALALDMLIKYVEDRKIELLGISSNKRDEGSVEFIDALTTWYGYPEIPIGHVVNGQPCDDAVNYALETVKMSDTEGNPLFSQSHSGDGHIIPSIEMYRKLLAAQKDSSVTVISVGFSTNLAQLLDSPADEYSPLSGKELVAKKVRNLVTMAGDFENNNPADSMTRFREYNVVKDVEAARKVFAEWPGEIVTSPFELGLDVCYPAQSIENDFNWVENHPVVEAYKVYLKMPYDRPTWDLTSVLYAVEGTDGYFTLSQSGTIEVEPLGGTIFTPDINGMHRYLLSDSIQKANIVNRFTTIIPSVPAKYK